MLNQRLQQKLLQKLSPQQILLMKLLQIPYVGLEQRIKQEIEENPALDELDHPEESDEDNASDSENEFDGDQEDEINDEYDKESEEFSLSDYMDDDDIPSYRLKSQNRSSDDLRKEIPFVSTTSFRDFLHSQLGLRTVTEMQRIIGDNIIGNLDDSGYLQRNLDAMVDDLAFSQNIEVTKDEILEVLKMIQDFDPPGVASKNLKECLLAQVKDTPENEKLRTLISDYLDELSKLKYYDIMKKLMIDKKELSELIFQLKSY